MLRTRVIILVDGALGHQLTALAFDRHNALLIPPLQQQQANQAVQREPRFWAPLTTNAAQRWLKTGNQGNYSHLLRELYH
jgi:hypothetical protein